MEIEASAEALAADTAAPVELSEDDQLDEIYERLSGETEEAEKPAEPEVEKAEEPEPEPEVEAPPSVIPGKVKDHWAEIPKEARDAIASSQLEMSAKLAEGQRLVSGLAPIKDAMVQAARDNPHLADMKPADIAAQMLQLAKVSREFDERPVETIMGLIKKHNLTDAMRKAFTGQQVTEEDRQAPALMKQIEELQGRIEKLADPEYLRSQVAAVSTQERATEAVVRFAEKAEHWAELEPHIPLIIPAIKAKLGEGASAEDVLSQAYEVAKTIYLPETKAQKPAPDEGAKAEDPDRAKAALKAKSVNVTGKPQDRNRDLSEDELLEAAYARAMSR